MGITPFLESYVEGKYFKCIYRVMNDLGSYLLNDKQSTFKKDYDVASYMNG